MDKGNSFKEISSDLTTGGRKGDVAFSTLTAIHESPLKFGLIYVGSDDGLVHITKDGGNNWMNISNGLPQNMWVARVQASSHDEGTVVARDVQHPTGILSMEDERLRGGFESFSDKFVRQFEPVC